MQTESQLPQTAMEKFARSLEPLPMDESGRVVAHNTADQRRVARHWLSSGALPKAYDSVEKVEFAIRYLSGLGLDPAISLKDTWWAGGVLHVCNNVPLAACRKHPSFDRIDEYLVDRDNKRRTRDNFIGFEPVGAVCLVWRKGTQDPTEGLFTYAEADKAGLRTKDNWRKWGPTMLAMRARSIALKKAFADVLQGVSIAEYDDTTSRVVALHPETVSASALPPERNAADEFNDMFAQGE